MYNIIVFKFALVNKINKTWNKHKTGLMSHLEFNMNQVKRSHRDETLRCWNKCVTSWFSLYRSWTELVFTSLLPVKQIVFNHLIKNPRGQSLKTGSEDGTANMWLETHLWAEWRRRQWPFTCLLHPHCAHVRIAVLSLITKKSLWLGHTNISTPSIVTVDFTPGGISAVLWLDGNTMMCAQTWWRADSDNCDELSGASTFLQCSTLMWFRVWYLWHL